MPRYRRCAASDRSASVRNPSSAERGPIQNLRYVMEKWTRLLTCLKSRVEMHS